MYNITIEKVKTITGHNDCVYTLEGSSDPGKFFSASGDGMIVSWDLANPDTGQLVAKLPNSVYALKHHAETGLLIAGQNYEGIHLLDAQNKKEVGSLQLGKAAIFDIQTLDKDAFIASGDGTLVKLDLETLGVMRRLQVSDKSARCISINVKRGELAVGFSDWKIRIFDFDLNLITTIDAHNNSVFSVRYSPDDRYLFSGSRDARLRVWDSESNYTKAAEIVAHMYAINHLDFSPDTKHFVTCSLDKTLKVWDAAELQLLKVIDRARHGGHLTSVNKVLWTTFHDQLLSASDDRTISVWHIIF